MSLTTLSPDIASRIKALQALDKSLATGSDELAAGIKQGFPVLSIRAGVFRLKSGATERPLLRNGNPNDPVRFVDVVIVAANPTVSKTYYASRYVEGSDEGPTCWSHDGVKPDAAVPVNQRQSPSCAGCPQNAWGSRITEDGRQAKACSDSKRLALVFADMILDGQESLGGPMLLRVPPASLSALAQYAATLGQAGLKSYAVVTRIGFDLNASAPKLTFSVATDHPFGPVLDEERFQAVLKLRESQQVKAVLSMSDSTQGPAVVEAVPAPAPAPAQTLPQPQAAATPTKPAARVTATPAAAPSGLDEFLSSILGQKSS